MPKSWGKAAQGNKRWVIDFISCQRPHVISRALARRGPGTGFVKDKMQIIWAAHQLLILSAQFLHTERGIKFTHCVCSCIVILHQETLGVKHFSWIKQKLNKKSGRIELKCMSGNVFTSHQHSTLAEALVRVLVHCKYLQSVYSELLKSHPKRRN